MHHYLLLYAFFHPSLFSSLAPFPPLSLTLCNTHSYSYSYSYAHSLARSLVSQMLSVLDTSSSLAMCYPTFFLPLSLFSSSIHSLKYKSDLYPLVFLKVKIYDRSRYITQSFIHTFNLSICFKSFRFKLILISYYQSLAFFFVFVVCQFGNIFSAFTPDAYSQGHHLPESLVWR